MTNEAAWKLYERYLEGWKAISVEERNKIAAEVLADDVQYSTRLHESGNRQTAIEDMAAFQTKFRGGHFDIGDVSGHHEHALLTWVLVQADGTVFAKGHDQIRVSQEGKIVSLITFPPSTSNPQGMSVRVWEPAKKSSAQPHDQLTDLFEPSERRSMTIPFDITLPHVNVLGSTMAYREAGDPQAPVALFLHGNPTSSYIWRNIIPLVAPVAYCIAPDLIGFGQSGKPDIEYRFTDHARYLDEFLERVGISSAYVIAQDWGTGLAFHLAARRPEFIRGLAFMEFIRPIPSWDDLHGDAVETFKKFRTPGVGEKMILEDNAFVEGLLPAAIVRKLTAEEMSVYRAPFPTPESRRPTWRFPNEVPIAGQPADVYLTMEKAHHALAESSYPKLLFAGDPGAFVSPEFARSFAKGLTNCRVVQLSSGIHYLQEDHPDVIGSQVKEWLVDLGVG